MGTRPKPLCWMALSLHRDPLSDAKPTRTTRGSSATRESGQRTYQNFRQHFQRDGYEDSLTEDV